MIYWLYLRLRVRRFINLATRGRFGRSRAAAGRGTNAPKRHGSPWLAGLLALVLLYGTFGIAQAAMLGLTTDLLRVSYLCVAFMVALCMTMGQREFAAAEWDLEWLITFPISKTQLIAMRLFERTFFNPVSLFLLFPILTLFLYRDGHGWAASAAYAYLLALPLFAILATIQTLIDTGLRVHLRVSNLRNIQAIFSIGSLLLFYTSIPRDKSAAITVRWLAQLAGPWLWPTPPAQAALAAGGAGWQPIVLLAVEALLALGVGTVAILWLLRDGVVANAGQVSGPRLKSAGVARIPGTTLWSPMVGKELKLLARDRNYLVQTLLTPFLILAMQIYLHTSKAWEAGAGLHLIALTGFGMASYALVFSAFNILSAEGQALWLWYCFPYPPSALLVQKVRPWIGVALLYWLAFLAYGIYTHPYPSFEFLTDYGLALIGIGNSVGLATALGVFSFDPQSLETGKRLNISYLYLYMGLSSIYGGLFFLTDPWQRGVGVILTVLLSYAFWQKAKSQLPYLLDPTEAPPPSVSLADGMIAAYGFFLLQAVIFHFKNNLLLAFSIAGLIVYAIARIYYARTGTRDLPSYRTSQPARAVLYGVCVGLTCAVLAFFYIDWIESHGWFSEYLTENMRIGGDKRLMFAILAVLAAPIFEEFIYRGIVLQGLALTMRPAAAIFASALMFAAMHPPAGMLPVFILGLTTATLARRLGSLLPSTIAHAVYNFCVIVVPWWISVSSGA